MPQKSNSLLTRLVLRVSLVMIVSIALLSGIVYLQINNTLVSMRDQTVEKQARTVALHLRPSKGLNQVLLDMPDSLRQFYSDAGDDYQYAVLDDMGNILFSSPVAYTDFFPNDFSRLGSGKFTFTGPGGQKYVGATLQTAVGGKNLYIQVAQTKDVSDVFLDE
ncbi:MAG: sensor histidine kinase N-terminal domain-containing protein, partial [Alphaproteobacteria bacterium]|nr:sensor histidine kinase N-terminal domain-containing protein [Alphaproteobacteria bacterium]